MQKFLNKKNKRFTALLLGMLLTLSMGMTAFAAETNSASDIYVSQVSESTPLAPKTNTAPTPAEVTSARSASGYEAHYTDSLMDEFKVPVNGSSSSTGKAYIKAWDFPAGTRIVVSLQKPDGTLAFSNVQLTIGQETSRTIYGLQTGTYKLIYTVHGVDKGWIYCRIVNS